MGDPVDIHNLLQTGYFTTSRHKNKDSDAPEIPSVLQPAARRERNTPLRHDGRSPTRRPPPPMVEEEDVVLKREHGTQKTTATEEEPNSRGDVDQNPLIMEVHEFNPERRFVILNEDPNSSHGPSGEPANGNENSTAAPQPKPSGEASPKPETREKFSPREDGSKRHRRTPSEGMYVPNNSRRRSRHDLPVIHTDIDDNRASQHHRSQSAATGPRPDFFSSRQPRPFGDQMLSPDVITQGSGSGRREQGYYAYGDSSRRENPSLDRYGDGKSRTPPELVAKSSKQGSESRSPARPISIDRETDSRNRDYHRGSYYDDTSSRQYARSANSSSRSSAKVSRDHSRSNDEYSKSPRVSPNVKKPLATKGDVNTNSSRNTDSEEDVKKRRPPRSQTTPLPAAKAANTSKPVQDEASVPRTATTSSVNDRGAGGTNSTLPYPEEDVFYIDPIDLPDVGRRADEAKKMYPVPEPAYMPDIPPEVVVESKSSRRTADTSSAAAEGKATSDPKSWKPPAFDPERDGTRLQRPVGAFRRYSESREEDGTQKLPECKRTNPVAGLNDWLTLPRTDFNICSGCYESVFSKSDYRTEFQPVLRPTVDAISCDFGSSPWYRIAWLLTEKNRDDDLRLFYHIASIASKSRGFGCPGQRKTARQWYTVWDPVTKRAVPEFTVCYQCAKTVETLLPSLSGVFVAIDPKSDPFRSVCALHFTPERKAFVMYFDSFETVAEKAAKTKKSPDLRTLAHNLERLSTHNECREDKPITDGYWHFMQFIPDFTVCGDCFEDVVRPWLHDENAIARNFYVKPQRVSRAACQLYSSRMRDVFKRACRRNDAKYLESKVRERRSIESSIKAKLAKLDREVQKDARTDKQIDNLIEEWKEWE